MFHVTEGSRSESVLAFCLATLVVFAEVLVGCLIGGAPSQATYICLAAIAVDVGVMIVLVPRIERSDRA